MIKEHERLSIKYQKFGTLLHDTLHAEDFICSQYFLVADLNVLQLKLCYASNCYLRNNTQLRPIIKLLVFTVSSSNNTTSPPLPLDMSLQISSLMQLIYKFSFLAIDHK